VRRAPVLAGRAVRDVGGNFAAAVEESVERRPIASLCLAIGIGFLLGATWSR